MKKLNNFSYKAVLLIGLLFGTTFLMLTCASCQDQQEPNLPSDSEVPEQPITPGKPEEPEVPEPAQPEPPTPLDFYKGADISWVTEMESKGLQFHEKDGTKRECTELMKISGINAIRLRVWVNPAEHGNWCNAQDVLAKALRARNLGMHVMIDFHYSDWWADPGKQNIPAAWKNYNYEQMKKAVTHHTVEVLTLLKKNNVEPTWVQVGNETNSGFLWPMGSTQNPAQYAGLFQAGYAGVKQVFPNAQVIVHIASGANFGLFKWNLDLLKNNGAHWDMIGMSVYPYWDHPEGGEKEWNQTITDVIHSINALNQRYHCPIMVVETGMLCANEQGKLALATTLETGYKLLKRLIQDTRSKTNGACQGVFYWEPECQPSQYKLGAFTQDGFPTRIMNAFQE